MTADLLTWENIRERDFYLPIPKAEHIGPTWDRGEDGKFVLPELTLGWQAIEWAQKNLLMDGSPLKFTQEQARLLLHWYEVDEAGSFVYRQGTVQRLKGWGKDPFAAAVCAIEFVGPCRFAGWAAKDIPELGLVKGDPVAKSNPNAWVQIAAVSQEQPLALDTRVRTPQGWTTVGRLRVGDEVFDEAGAPRRVMRETEIFDGLKCYRVTFDDGQSVVASASHGWTVETPAPHGDAHHEVTVTTEGLAALAGNPRRRPRIPLTLIERPPIDLPIDPYWLGVWLGDGWSANSVVTSGHNDAAEMKGLLQDCIGDGPRFVTMHQRLGLLGVRGNKHIPPAYLDSSIEQRVALIQGLMDSDGHYSDGQYLFTNTNEQIIDGLVEALRSVGEKPHKRRRQGGFTVSFRPHQSWQYARLQRKQRTPTPGRYPYRYVRSVEPVDSVPVKCIGIDTPKHLFQVEGGILTHNTQNTMKVFQTLFTQECRDTHMIEVGKQLVYAYGAQRTIQSVTRSPRSLEGNRPSFVVGNESHHWLPSNDGHEMAKAIRRNAAKSKGGAARAMFITNAYQPGESSVAQVRRETYLDGIARGRTGRSMGVLYDSLEAPQGARLMLPERELEDGTKVAPTEVEVKAYIGAILDSVRGDAWYLDVPRLTAEILDEETTTEESRRFYYNQIDADETTWVHPFAVDASVDERAADAATAKVDPLRDRWIVSPRDPIVMFFDGSKSLDATALVGCRVSDGHTFLLGVWQRPAGARGRTWRAPRQEIDSRVTEVMERFNVVAFWADPSHAQDDDMSSRYWDGMIDDWHRRFRDRLQLWAVKSGTTQHSIMWDMTSPERSKQFVDAAQTFVEEMEQKNDIEDFAPSFTTCGHPVLMTHLKNACEAPSKWGTTLSKPTRKSRRKIDAAVCAVGARMLRRYVLNTDTKPEEQAPATFWSY